MAIADGYRKQAALLIRALPFIAPEQKFALKGGTAINLFVRDLPRLSVDIDLTYVPIADRATSLKAIDAGMKRIAAAITKGIRGAQTNASQPQRRELHDQADTPHRGRAGQDRGHAGTARLRLGARH